ncbi:CAP domain-containing protein [Clostridium cadaveris]|uniref:CAP domain-containing protein n=1 Tax=Clostridium cadaveris TaxID=1529 RepID=UPI0039A06CCB
MKKLKINDMLKNKKVLAVSALVVGVIAVGIVGTIYSKNKDSVAVEKKSESGKIDVAKEEKKAENADIVLTEDENGNLVATDKEGKIVAEGEEVAKFVEEKKSKGETIVAKTENGSVISVDKVEGNKVTSSSGETVKPTPEPPVADNPKPTPQPEPSPEPQPKSEEPSKPEPIPPTPAPEPTPNPPAPQPEPPKRTWQYMADMSRETFNLMNQFRQQNGVAALKWSDVEHTKAKKQCEDNAQKSISNHGFDQISLLRGGSGMNITSSMFIRQWEKSPSHRESMLDKRNIEGAVAVYKDSDGVCYVVASFADGFGWD